MPRDAANKFFEDISAKKVGGRRVLFPNDSYPTPRDAAAYDIVQSTRGELEGAVDEHGRVGLYLAACIYYTFASDVERYHQTNCLYEVLVSGSSLILANGSYDAGQLSLEESGFLGMEMAS
jgi:hypothetical protein